MIERDGNKSKVEIRRNYRVGQKEWGDFDILRILKRIVNLFDFIEEIDTFFG